MVLKFKNPLQQMIFDYLYNGGAFRRENMKDLIETHPNYAKWDVRAAVRALKRKGIIRSSEDLLDARRVFYTIKEGAI